MRATLQTLSNAARPAGRPLEGADPFTTSPAADPAERPQLRAALQGHADRWSQHPGRPWPDCETLKGLSVSLSCRSPCPPQGLLRLTPAN
jgi:hypothetical protein